MDSSYKIMSGIDQECKLLVTDVAACGEKLRISRPELELVVWCSPERVVFQAGSVGLSLSRFKSRPGEAPGASVMVAGWEGEITLPGQAPSDRRHAKQISESMFELKRCEDSSWKWAANADDALITSHDLAERCVAEMEARVGDIETEESVLTV